MQTGSSRSSLITGTALKIPLLLHKGDPFGNVPEVNLSVQPFGNRFCGQLSGLQETIISCQSYLETVDLVYSFEA